MKKWAVVLIFVMIAGFGFYASDANAQMGPGRYQGDYGPGEGYSDDYCPGCGRYIGPSDRYSMGSGRMGRGYGYGMGPGMMGRGYGYGMGPGMMGRGYGYGYGMGPGMMGPGYGYGMGPGYGYGPQSGQRYSPQYQQPEEPLSQEDVQRKVNDFIQSSRNPNLKVGDIQEKGNSYEVSIVTKDGSLVDKMMVDKNTGRMRSAY